MKLRLLLVLSLVLAAGPAFAQKVYIDYDPGYDGASVETFAWKTTSETSLADANPLMHSRIVNGIEYYLTMGGVREDNDDPDVYVTYHTSTKEEISVNTTNWGYGYPGGWAYGGYYGAYGYGYGGGLSTTHVSTYERGTLVVDVWDVKTNEMIWRGMAANITVTDNPKKMESRVDKALKKIVNQWKKIKARDQKRFEQEMKKAEKEAAKAAGG